MISVIFFPTTYGNFSFFCFYCSVFLVQVLQEKGGKRRRRGWGGDRNTMGGDAGGDGIYLAEVPEQSRLPMGLLYLVILEACIPWSGPLHPGCSQLSLK